MTIKQVLQHTPKAASISFKSAVDHIYYLVANVPTTALRMLVTMYIALRTTAHYMNSDTWLPSTEWLAFILVMSGADVAQYYAKRKTTFPPTTEPPPTV